MIAMPAMMRGNLRRAETRRNRAAPAAGTVVIWSAMLDDQPEPAVRRLASVLSADEHTRAQQFHFAQDRRRYETGRGILRMLLGRYLQRPPHEIALQYGLNGKPALATGGDERPGLHFNVAHTEGFAVYAFTRVGEVGIDVERIRPIPEWKEIAAAQFSDAERARVHAASDADRAVEFFRAWTRQEAVVKATGEGLGGNPRVVGGFSVTPVPVPPGYVAALAANPAARRLELREWPPAEDSDPPPTCCLPLAPFSDHATDTL